MRNQKLAEPLQRRLSEPTETPAEGGASTDPMAGLVQRAGTLLQNVPRPQELSPAARARIAERLSLGSPPRPWWQWAATSTAALGAVTLAAILLPRLFVPRPAEGLVVRELRVPASGLGRLRVGTGSELLLVGPGSLTRSVGTDVAQLAAGRLAVRAANEDVLIDAGGRRVTVPKGHAAEIVVDQGELVRVAAYVGDSRFLDRERPLPVRAGTAWTRDGERPLSEACRGLVLAALDGGPWPSSGPCSDQPADPTTAPVVVTALPAEPLPVRGAPEPGVFHPRPAPRAVKPSAPAAPAATAAAAPLPAVSATGEPADSGLAAESRLLGVVLHQLHQERDGGAALRSLDSYQQRFPSGLLGEEAQAARVDALLLLDHRSEALQLLDRTQFQRLGRGGELRVVRAELRATAGRCREALADFAAVLSGAAASPPPPVAERALYGQASCQAELGDPQGARAGLLHYLARFPTGRFADAARRSLQNLQ